MSGGGSYNPNIVNYLKERMPDTRITYIDETGIPIGAKEALGFALLTHECFVGRPMIVPRETESDKPGLIGQIQPAKNMHRIRQAVAQVSFLCPTSYVSILLIRDSSGVTFLRRVSNVPLRCICCLAFASEQRNEDELRDRDGLLEVPAKTYIAFSRLAGHIRRSIHCFI
jgi:hypothetical protein